MNIGLPCTGIGGIFYMLSALLMPVYELYITLKGRSSNKRWHLVIRQFLITVSIFGVIRTTGYLLNLLIPVVSGFFMPSTQSVGLVRYSGRIMYSSVVTLIVVIVLSWVLGMLIRNKDRKIF